MRCNEISVLCLSDPYFYWGTATAPQPIIPLLLKWI